MAIKCVICGKKQSGFIADFPLYNENEGLRICAKCQENKDILNKTKSVLTSYNKLKKCGYNVKLIETDKINITDMYTILEKEINE